jgi:hypothetical protein
MRGRLIPFAGLVIARLGPNVLAQIEVRRAARGLPFLHRDPTPTPTPSGRRPLARTPGSNRRLRRRLTPA